MPDNVNRKNAMTHTNIPYIVNARKRVTEPDNTVVVKHKRKSLTQQFKETFKGNK